MMKIFNKKIKDSPTPFVDLANFNIEFSDTNRSYTLTVRDEEDQLFFVGGKYCESCSRLEIEGCYNDSGKYGMHNYIRGLGTAAMNSFIEKCKQKNFSLLYGSIVPQHWNNTGIDKLKHFYEKFGFIVFINNELKQGRIELFLRN